MGHMLMREMLTFGSRGASFACTDFCYCRAQPLILGDADPPWIVPGIISDDEKRAYLRHTIGALCRTCTALVRCPCACRTWEPWPLSAVGCGGFEAMPRPWRSLPHLRMQSDCGAALWSRSQHNSDARSLEEVSAYCWSPQLIGQRSRNGLATRRRQPLSSHKLALEQRR